MKRLAPLAHAVTPIEYQLSLSIDPGESWFRGRVAIALRIHRPTRRIELNVDGLEIDSAFLLNDMRETLRPTCQVHPERRSLSCIFSVALRPGVSLLVLRYRARLRDDLRGCYAIRGPGGPVVLTQFETADARMAFPGFDQPGYKTPFRVRICCPKGSTAIANAALVRVLERAHRNEFVFERTAPLPTFLLGWTVGDLVVRDRAHTTDGIPVRVWTRPHAPVAVGIAHDHVRSLEWMEQQTGISYPYKKLDIIAAPSMRVRAMEQPGCVLYREDVLSPGASALARAATIAHESAHQWWGNLVTLKWWDSLWFTEAMATHLGDRMIHDFGFGVAAGHLARSRLERGLAADESGHGHPIHMPVQEPEDVDQTYDDITYGKAPAVLGMLEQWLGESIRTAMRHHLREHAHGNAGPDEFWAAAAERSGLALEAIANAWIARAGHPEIDLSTRRTEAGLQLVLRQRRFADDDATPGHLWPVPLRISYGIEATRASIDFVLDERSASLALPDAAWVFPDRDGTGVYRYRLDPVLLDGLLANVVRLSHVERHSLLCSLWASARVGRTPLRVVIRAMRVLLQNADAAILTAVAGQLRWLDTYVAPRWLVFAQLADELLRGATPDPSDPEAPAILQRSRLRYVIDAEQAAPYICAVNQLIRNPGSAEQLILDHLLVAARFGPTALVNSYAERALDRRGDGWIRAQFQRGLLGFHEPREVRRVVELCLTELPPHERAAMITALLGERHTRGATARALLASWNEQTASVDPLPMRAVITSLANVVGGSIQRDVASFLRARASSSTDLIWRATFTRLHANATNARRLRAQLGALEGSA